LPGSLLVPTRFALNVMNILFLAVVIKILCIGHNFKKGPIPNGCRKACISFMYKVCCPISLFLSGMTYNTVRQEADYSYYLGDNYREGYRDIKKTSTIISNHVSWLDCVILICHCKPAFAPDAAFRNVPLFNTTIECLDSIYIERGGDISKKEKTIKTIVDRQELIEETGRYAPLSVFAEGGTTNGKTLMRFRRGAFIGEKRITPLYLKYHYATLSPAYDVVEFAPIAILTLCCRGMRCDVNVMPDFEPNEYLFQTHAN